MRHSLKLHSKKLLLINNSQRIDTRLTNNPMKLFPSSFLSPMLFCLNLNSKLNKIERAVLKQRQQKFHDVVNSLDAHTVNEEKKNISLLHEKENEKEKKVFYRGTRRDVAIGIEIVKFHYGSLDSGIFFLLFLVNHVF